jgi:hypothetical protein
LSFDALKTQVVSIMEMKTDKIEVAFQKNLCPQTINNCCISGVFFTKRWQSSKEKEVKNYINTPRHASSRKSLYL